ncbi:MAG: hypothetical protein ABIT20_23025 [Gemmatimonadaceae bacterium]
MSVITTLCTIAACSASAQISRRGDMIANNGAYGCTQPKDKEPGEGSLLPGGASSTIRSIAAEVGGGVTQRRRLDAGLAATAHAHASIGRGLCEYSTALMADAYVADAGGLGGVVEFVVPALSFGGITGDRFLGSVEAYAGASATRRETYDPLVSLSRDAWIGATTRLHVPVTVFGAHITFYPTVSVQGDWAWDETVRATRGNSVVPHYAFALPLPLDRFNLVGLGYVYDRVERFAGSDVLQRHMLSLTHATEKDAAFRLSARGSVEYLAGRRLLREAALVVSLKPRVF